MTGLEQFCDTIISGRIVFEAPHKHHRHGNVYHMRIDLRVPGEELVISRDPGLHSAHTDPYVTLHDAFDEAKRQLQDYVRRRRYDVKTLELPLHGYVARLVRDDGGYGFIRTLEGREIYFHSRSVLNNHYDLLKTGAEVRFSEEFGDEGPQASSVEVVGSQGRSFPGNLRKVS
jgi:cold shock CspA family protein